MKLQTPGYHKVKTLESLHVSHLGFNRYRFVTDGKTDLRALVVQTRVKTISIAKASS